MNNKQKQLDKIAQEIARCRTCKKDKIGLPVPGEGNPDADVVFLGEAPGKKEAQTGRPFIGPAGKILRALIADAGLKESVIFITSPVKYLPKHVTPTPEEIAHGRKHLFAQLDVIRPKIIVLMGRVACLAMLERNCSIAKEHGNMIEHGGRKYFICFHPAAPLHAPKVRPLLVDDFKKLKRLLKKT
jgi:uracil-DNA glycosylase